VIPLREPETQLGKWRKTFTGDGRKDIVKDRFERAYGKETMEQIKRRKT